MRNPCPGTAEGYNNVAFNLNAQGKYAQTQPLFEKALEINRRVLTDDHPNTARATAAWRPTSTPRGSTPRPSHFQKALEICRRLLTDDHPDTA